MNEALQRKEIVSALVDVLTQAIRFDRLEDAEAVLACVRALRPKLAELDAYEAWIEMKRGFWTDAIRILRNAEASAKNWALGKALMAFCQYACGDPGWRATANDVVENGHNTEATNLVMLLIDPEAALAEDAQAADGGPNAPRPANEIASAQQQYVRA